MYSVHRCIHKLYGPVIQIEIDIYGEFAIPFFAVQRAKREFRLWKEEGTEDIRFLICDNLIHINRIESWANEEYKSLPKCDGCSNILNGQCYTHKLSSIHRFCSQNCADKEYLEKMEILKDEEEIDYL